MGKYYEGPINPSHDWGAIKDPEDGKVKPASGNAVQTYIKQQFKTKAGCFYLDPTNNRYIVFADAESRDMYLANPALTHLIIATFDAPFNYTASINLLTAQYNAIGDGSTWLSRLCKQSAYYNESTVEQYIGRRFTSHRQAPGPRFNPTFDW